HNGGEAALGAKMLRIAPYLLERLRCGFEHKAVDDLLVLVGNGGRGQGCGVAVSRCLPCRRAREISPAPVERLPPPRAPRKPKGGGAVRYPNRPAGSPAALAIALRTAVCHPCRSPRE